VELKVISNEWW